MKFTALTASAVASLATLVMAPAASASVVVISNQSVWNMYTALQGATMATETFESFPEGYGGASATGTAGSTTWNASSKGGLYFGAVGGQQAISTLFPNTTIDGTLNFTFAPGVQGIGGEFFGLDENFNVVLANITVTLGNGSTYTTETKSATNFVGFYSSGAAISSISISTSTLNMYPAVGNLYFATVPAPGAIALLCLSGIAGTRSRRRAMPMRSSL
jgi:hypothetical protein